MTDPLPAPLAAVEAELAARPGVPPDAALRGRVLAAVGRELDAGAPRWWAGAAAAALLWANLSLSVALDAGWRTTPAPAPDSAAAAELHALLPDLSESEAARLVTGSWPAPGPVWRGAPPIPEELPAWDTH